MSGLHHEGFVFGISDNFQEDGFNRIPWAPSRAPEIARSAAGRLRKSDKALRQALPRDQRNNPFFELYRTLPDVLSRGECIWARSDAIERANQTLTRSYYDPFEVDLFPSPEGVIWLESPFVLEPNKNDPDRDFVWAITWELGNYEGAVLNPGSPSVRISALTAVTPRLVKGGPLLAPVTYLIPAFGRSPMESFMHLRLLRGREDEPPLELFHAIRLLGMMKESADIATEECGALDEDPPDGQPRRNRGRDRVVRVVRVHPGRGGSQRHAAQREYQTRWNVRGHWREQRYGKGRKKTRRVWIKPHIKGPEDRPLAPPKHVVHHLTAPVQEGKEAA